MKFDFSLAVFALVFLVVAVSLPVLFFDSSFSVSGRSVEDAASFNNPIIDYAVDQSETSRYYGYEASKAYGYVEAPSYGEIAIDGIKQVFTSLVGEPANNFLTVVQQDKPVIDDLEDLKKIICPGYSEKESSVSSVQTYYDKNGQVTSKPKEETTIKYEYDNSGKLVNEVESMAGKSRRFIADAG